MAAERLDQGLTDAGAVSRVVAAENAPGVKLVLDHLVWIEPDSGFVIHSEEDEARAKACKGKRSAAHDQHFGKRI